MVHRLMQIKHTYTQNKVLNGGTVTEDGLEVKSPYCSPEAPDSVLSTYLVAHNHL